MIFNLARKELKSMFASPMGWVILSVLIFAFATYFINAVTQYYEIMTGSVKSVSYTHLDVYKRQA